MSFCHANSTSAHIQNLLSGHTPCVVDTLILGFCYLLGLYFLASRQAKLQDRGAVLYTLKGAARVYQWFAVCLSVVCFILSFVEFIARLSSIRVFISPSGSLAPYEGISYVIELSFWLATSGVLYYEVHRFTWTALWTIRFALCLVFAGELGKLSVFVERGVAAHNAMLFAPVCFVTCTALLAIFAVTQYPRPFNLEGVIREEYLPLNEKQESTFNADEEIVPERKSNCFSRMSCSWMSPLLRQGSKQHLNFQNIWLLDTPDQAQTLHSRFQKHWREEVARRHNRRCLWFQGPSLFRAIRRTMGLTYVIVAAARMLTGAVLIVRVSIFCLLIMEWLEDGYRDKWLVRQLVIDSVVVFLAAEIETLITTWCDRRLNRVGFQMRSIVSTEVQRKTLCLAPRERSRFSAGQILNFVTSDVEYLQLTCRRLVGWVEALTAFVGRLVIFTLECYKILWTALGVFFVANAARMILSRILDNLGGRADHDPRERTALEELLIRGIFAVKLNAWDKPLLDMIGRLRKSEMAFLWGSAVQSAAKILIVDLVPLITKVIVLGVIVASTNDLGGLRAVLIVGVIDFVITPVSQSPESNEEQTQARKCIKRLEEFLLADELPQDGSSRPPAPEGETAIKLNGDFAWNIDVEPCLPGLKLDIPSGSLTAIVGPTGSGKTSILSSTIGQMQRISGTPSEIYGRLCFVPQTPFIINATIRDNILFGADYDEERYTAAIQAASLGPDLDALPGSDVTELGENGVNVSEGQKQRIALARAVYSDADICLLDDPLSTLDAHVGLNVFHDCIKGAMKGKTVLLVTSQPAYPKEADQILFVENGRITEQGTYDELMNTGVGLARMMTGEAFVEKDSVEDGTVEAVESRKTTSRGVGDIMVDSVDSEPAEIHRLIEDEGRASAPQSHAAIRQYVEAMGGRKALILLLSLFLLREVVGMGSIFWLVLRASLRRQAAKNEDTENFRVHDDSTDSGRLRLEDIYIFALISLCHVVLTFVTTVAFKKLGIAASEKLHCHMVQRLVRSAMAFFYRAPVSGVLGRLAKDTFSIDYWVVDHLLEFIRTILEVASVLLLIAVAAPFSLPLIVCAVALIYHCYEYYKPAARDLRPLLAVSRASVYSSIIDAAEGVATIRAFSAEGSMAERHKQLVDDSVIVDLLTQSATSWLSVRVGTLTSVVTAMTVLLVLERNSLSIRNGHNYIIGASVAAKYHRHIMSSI